MATGLPPAPRWAWIVMALGVVAIIVLTYFTLNRPPPPGFTAPPDPAAAAAEPANPARILVVGDDYTAGSPIGGAGAAAWPQLVAADLSAAGRAVGVTVAAANGAGYRRAAPDGSTFPLLAAQAGTDYDLVVFFGSRNDNATAAEVQAAATETFAAVRAASPEALFLVIGPAWNDVPPPGFLLTNRDAVVQAAEAVGATLVDPLEEAWFTGAAEEFVGSDGIHPTDQGHRYLADLIRPRIESALPAAS